MSKTDPAHYPVDLFEIADQLGGLNNRLFSAFKYIARAGKKPGESVSDDLRKAIKCLEMEIARLEPAPPEQRFTPSDMAEYHNPDHPANAVKCPKASEPADPEWDALTANMTTPA